MRIPLLVAGSALSLDIGVPLTLVLVALAALFVLAVVALCLMATTLARCAQSLRRSAEALERESAALHLEMSYLLEQAQGQVPPSPGAVGPLRGFRPTHQKQPGRARDVSSRLAYAAIGEPLIKVAALGAGTARVAERIRGRNAAGTSRREVAGARSRPARAKLRLRRGSFSRRR